MYLSDGFVLRHAEDSAEEERPYSWRMEVRAAIVVKERRKAYHRGMRFDVKGGDSFLFL